MSSLFVPQAVTVTTVDGKEASEYATVRDYLKSVVELPMTIKAFANDDQEMPRYPGALLGAPVRRELLFKEGLVPSEPLADNGFGTNKVPSNFLSLLVFVSGVPPAQDCKGECDNKFAFCIVPRLDLDYENKLGHIYACANCHYNGSATRCSLRPEKAKDAGKAKDEKKIKQEEEDEDEAYEGDGSELKEEVDDGDYEEDDGELKEEIKME
ncbi:unnamed protein product [Discula destructiva]